MTVPVYWYILVCNKSDHSHLFYITSSKQATHRSTRLICVSFYLFVVVVIIIESFDLFLYLQKIIFSSKISLLYTKQKNNHFLISLLLLFKLPISMPSESIDFLRLLYSSATLHCRLSILHFPLLWHQLTGHRHRPRSGPLTRPPSPCRPWRSASSGT